MRTPERLPCGQRICSLAGGILPVDQFAGVSVHDVKLPIAEAILPRAFDLVDTLGGLSSATLANADRTGYVRRGSRVQN